MTLPVNPYAPTSTSAETPLTVEAVDVDPSADAVRFQAYIDEDCWHRIRVTPPPQSRSWMLAWVMIGCSVAMFTLLVMTSFGVRPISTSLEGFLRGPLLLIALLTGTVGLVGLMVCLDMRRIAFSRRQREVQPWCRGNIHGQISADGLILHSDTVSLSIPAYVVTKLQWGSQALQVFFGPTSVPAVPERRISIPEEAFQDGKETALPLEPKRHVNMKGMGDEACQRVVDALLASFPEDQRQRDWWLPIDNHLRWNDLEWLKQRTYLRRIVQFAVLLTIGLFVLFWYRAITLPTTWRPKVDALATTMIWMIVPVGATMLYLVMYHLPIVAGRSLMRLQGMIAGDRNGQNRLVCLRTGLFAVAYRGQPTDYAKWTEHGLEIWAEPSRMLFVIPKRVFPIDEHPMITEIYREPAEPRFDSAKLQHWEGPRILPGGSVTPL